MAINHKRLLFLTLLLSSAIRPHAWADESGYQPLEEIRLAATEFAKRTLTTPDLKNSIEAGQLDSRLLLRRCDTPLTTEALGQRGNSSNVTVIVKCDDGVKPWTVYVPVKVMTYIKVAVAKRPLARGVIVSAQDIMFEQREISRLGSGYIESLDDIVGRPPKRLLAKGAAISPRDLEIAKLISKGNRVSIVAETNGISVRMPGKALEDAGKGDQIPVENLSSRRTVIGTVVAPGIVKVTM